LSSKILVVGDIILDRTIECDVSRVSPEAPVVIGRQRGAVKETLGGAGNVALNLYSFGYDVELRARVGADEEGAKLVQLCEEAGIEFKYDQVGDSFRTTTKTRFVSQGHIMFRFDQEWSETTDRSVDCTGIDGSSVVVLSDYDKGLFDKQSAQLIISTARTLNIPVVADFKPKNAEWFTQADIITPNEDELFGIYAPPSISSPRSSEESALWHKMQDVSDFYEVPCVVCTRGAKGIVALLDNGHRTVIFPARARQVFDVTGAGDTVTAGITAYIATYADPSLPRPPAGADPAAALDAWLKEVTPAAIAFANVAAGLAVEVPGATAVDWVQVRAAQRDWALASKIVNPERIAEIVGEQQRSGSRVVITNGCFDLLHQGHVHLLQGAAAQGDCLVVALNSDRSVADLKGDGRPVLPLDVRAKAVAAIPQVDYVTCFDEATPERLIKKIKPDVLVKGASADESVVPGADFVASIGGRIHFVDELAGFSTSDTLAARLV
jgi:D-beta-D-heptose 7-phosphate kinase/D-beta-D-heptose 1-phosphate adenosyltransferase